MSLPPDDEAKKPKYQQLLEHLSQAIRKGEYRPGSKLPSEAALVKQFSTSRITVGRALRELQQAGLVERFAGSGTYVRKRDGKEPQPLLFGLLIPDLGETEIFGPICQGIANASDGKDQALLWGHVNVNQSKEEQAKQLCRQFIDRQVSGVFFAPLEFEIQSEKTNRWILNAFAESGIPVVLVDRRLSYTPDRHRPDVVGINNKQAGYLATEHLIQMGCKHIGFLGYHGAAFTIQERMTGYKEALAAHGLRVPFEVDEGTAAENDGGAKPDVEAFVCANDQTAGNMMHSFLSQGLRIPGRYPAGGDRRCALCQFAAGAPDDGAATVPRNWRRSDAHDAASHREAEDPGAGRAAGRAVSGTAILWGASVVRSAVGQLRGVAAR